MKLPYFFALAAILSLATLQAQENIEKKAPTFTVQINQDNVFGFYPVVFGSWGLSEKTSFTYYATFWTNPSFGTGNTGGDLWLETGAGLLFFASREIWLINPTLGFTHGKLLSGGTQGVIGDGIVPALASYYDRKLFDGEVYISYYKSLRKQGPVTSDYLLYWLYPGINLSPRMAIGVHHEALMLTRSTGADAEALYRWLGGFIKFKIGSQYIFRFAAGKNFDENSGNSPEYYKMTVNLNF